MKKNYSLGGFLVLCLSLFFANGWAQVTTFSYTGAAETYVIPVGVTSIEIEVSGAEGGSGNGGPGGLGATMIGTFDVTPGDVLDIVVGEAGAQYGNSGGGGGGSGVILAGVPLIIAGGGGGGATNAAGHGGVITEEGGSSSGAGGTAGSGGEKGYRSGDCGWASGGGGFSGDGYGGNGAWDGGALPGTLAGAGAGSSWASGGAGGSDGGCTFTFPNEGAWGCGGGGAGSYGGAGGGGYSGGGGGQYVDPVFDNRGGGGGGSYNDGTDQVNTPNNHAGNGEIIITVLCNGLVTDIPVTGVCIGSPVTLSATSSTGGTITWSGGVTDGVPFVPALGTTTYTATSSSLSDCLFEVEISASEVPTVTAHSSTPVACEGSAVLVWGEGADDYVWTGSGAIDPMDSTEFAAEDGMITYTVVGSVLGCEAPPVDLILEGAPQPDVVGSATPAEICLGESFTISGSGAVNYDWGATLTDGDAITPLTEGTFVYTVIGTSDVGCGDTATAVAIVHPVPLVDAGLDQTECVDMMVTLTASGADSYSWTGGVTDGVAFAVSEGETTYTVTGTDENGCEDTDDVTVTGIGIPVISGTVEDEYSPFGASIDLEVTGGVGPFAYSWSHGPTTEDVGGLTEGTYTVIVDDLGVEDGICEIASETFTIMSYVGLEELTELNVQVYPNPFTELLTIVYDGEFQYELRALSGALIKTGTAFNQEDLSLTSLASGTYMVNVIANDQVSVVKVLKQ